MPHVSLSLIVFLHVEQGFCLQAVLLIYFSQWCSRRFHGELCRCLVLFYFSFLSFLSLVLMFSTNLESWKRNASQMNFCSSPVYTNKKKERDKGM